MECHTTTSTAGDHDVVIGEVTDLEIPEPPVA